MTDGYFFYSKIISKIVDIMKIAERHGNDRGGRYRAV